MERNREERENKSHTRFKYDTIYSEPLRIQTEWLHQLRLFASVYLLKIEFAYKWIGFETNIKPKHISLIQPTKKGRPEEKKYRMWTTYKRRRNKSFNRPFILFVMHHKSITVWSIDFNLTKKNINKKERNQESTGNSNDNSHNFYPFLCYSSCLHTC